MLRAWQADGCLPAKGNISLLLQLQPMSGLGELLAPIFLAECLLQCTDCTTAQGGTAVCGNISLTHSEPSKHRAGITLPGSILWLSGHTCARDLILEQPLLHLITAVVCLPAGAKIFSVGLCLFPLLRKVPRSDLPASNKYKAYLQQTFPINNYYSCFSERALSQHFNSSFK